MKPFVIYIEPNKNDKLTLNKEEFEQYIQDAYERGYADGKLANSGITITPNPLTPATPCTPWYTTPGTCGDLHPKTIPLTAGKTTSATLHS